MPKTDKIRIVVCMGSSCFSRGNSRLVKLLQDFVRDIGAEHRVDIAGSLCEDRCTFGPNITINGTRFSVTTPESCMQLVAQHLEGHGSSENKLTVPGAIS